MLKKLGEMCRVAIGTLFFFALFWTYGGFQLVDGTTWFLKVMPVCIGVFILLIPFFKKIGAKMEAVEEAEKESVQRFREESARKLQEMIGEPRERKDPPTLRPPHFNPYASRGSMPGSMGDDPGHGMWHDKPSPNSW